LHPVQTLLLLLLETQGIAGLTTLPSHVPCDANDSMLLLTAFTELTALTAAGGILGMYLSTLFSPAK
jgi:hypothetical protein